MFWGFSAVGFLALLGGVLLAERSAVGKIFRLERRSHWVGEMLSTTSLLSTIRTVGFLALLGDVLLAERSAVGKIFRSERRSHWVGKMLSTTSLLSTVRSLEGIAFII
ncbi:hypothetical protein CEXT_332051 [Caerostris extrusa]|uniref:Uncharacterized protein n=1 Tax=Caerostris extrusa TaxID=172846 RepID=A0AAV4RIB4_CAEEX|nr:hypothetical protein CEXT_332051 [Caerostris extrusa]